MKITWTIFGIVAFMQLYSCQSIQHNKLPSCDVTAADSSHFIPIDSANKMLGSYLVSINYNRNDTDLQSLVVNARLLRKYIDSMPGSDTITELKLMFAHTLSYANSSHGSTNAGYKRDALTIVIAACSANGNYVPYDNNKVMDYTSPCPPVCPPGNAASPFIIEPSIK